jgi:hypothetical protein
VKSGPKAYWLQNVAERKGGDAEFIE